MAFSRITTSTSTQGRTSKTQKRISFKNRHPLPLCLLRVLQFLTAVIALSIFASYLANLPTAITRANGFMMAAITSSLIYAAITVFTVFCIPYGSYILSVMMTVMDWVFVVAWVAIGVLVRPTNRCGENRVRKRQLHAVDRDGESDDEDDDEPGPRSSSSQVLRPIVTVTPTTTQGLAASTTIVSSVLKTGALSIPNLSGVQTTLVPSSSKQISSQLFVPTTRVSPLFTISTGIPTSISTGANGLPTDIALGQASVQVGISHGDCNLAMAVFVLAIIGVNLYFASIFAPCAFSPRKQQIEVEEEVYEKKSVNGEESLWSGSNDHVHDVLPAGGRSAVI